MGGRLALAALVGSFSSGTILAIFEVQGWTIPDWLAGVLISVLLLGLAICTLVAAFEVRVIAVSVLSRWMLRWPIVDKSRPPPHQWLSTIAEEDANDPTRHLLILRQIITDGDLRPELQRPWIEIGIELYNGGVHTVHVGDPSGHAAYKGIELRDPIECGGGKSWKPRGHVHTYKLKQYLPREYASAVHAEIAETGKLRSISLSNVRLLVQSQANMERRTLMALGASDTYVRPD